MQNSFHKMFNYPDQSKAAYDDKNYHDLKSKFDYAYLNAIYMLMPV